MGESEGLYWKYESFIKEQETRLGSCTGAVGEIFAIRRELYETPPAGIINDDFYLAMGVISKRRRLVYVPTARSWEQVSLTAQDEATRRARIIAGRYQALALAGRILPWNNPFAVWQVVSHKFMRPLVPFAMIGAFLSNFIALFDLSPTPAHSVWGLSWPLGLIIFILQIDFYTSALVGNYIEKGRVSMLAQKAGEGLQENKNYRLIRKLLYLPTFLVNSNMAALVGLYQYLRRRQNAVWQRVQRRE